jgi:hypothetical protein
MKLLPLFVQEHLRWYHMDSKATAGFIVLAHVDKNNLKFAFIGIPQLLHHGLHPLAGDAAHGTQFQHHDRAVLFSLSKYTLYIAGLAATCLKKQDRKKDQ